MRITKKLPSLANVGAGQTATLNCPVGLTYERIELEYSGVTLAEMKNVEVVVNGKPVMTFKDMARVEALNDYYGRAKTAGFITLHFARPEMNQLNDQRIMALGTQDVATLAVNIDIAASATAPVIKAHAVLSEPQKLGAFIKVREFQFDASVAGDLEISTLPKGPRIMAAHFFKADVDSVEVEIDSQRVFDGSKALIQSLQKTYGRVPQTALATHFDTVLEGDPSQSLSTRNAQDMRFRLELATAGGVSILVEYLDGFAGI
jgi:Viral coat protein P2 N-terminal domain